jgi:hypothetical protein
VNLRFRQLFNFGLGDQALRDRFGLDAGTIESASIVGDLNDYIAAFVIGRKPETGIGPSTAFRRKRGQCVDEAFNFGCAAATRSRPLTAH